MEDSTEVRMNEWKRVQAWPFALKRVLPWSGESSYQRARASMETLAQPYPPSGPQKGQLYCSLDPFTGGSPLQTREASLLDRVLPFRKTGGCSVQGEARGRQLATHLPFGSPGPRGRY